MALLGRYRGVVDALAGVLRTTSQMAVVVSCAADDAQVPGADELAAMLADADVAVVTVGPDDASLALLGASGWRGATLCVTWHPEDERVPVPGPVIEAGRIAAGLGTAVRRLVADS